MKLQPKPPRSGIHFLLEGAHAYNAMYGLPQPIEGYYVPVDEHRLRRIASFFEAQPHDIDREDVRLAYRELANETHQQFLFAQKYLGMTLEPWQHPGQPYKDSAEMIADIEDNYHYFCFLGGEPHPTLNTIWPDTGWRAHDEFRAVHDLFGHAKGGYEFGPRGEENAWLSHIQMYTEGAIPAVTTETRGHTAYYFFGSHNYDEKGNPRHLPYSKRPYGKQKAIILPSEALDYQQVFRENGIKFSRNIIICLHQ